MTAGRHDSGYAIGALLAGVSAALLGLRRAIGVVAGLTLASAVVVATKIHKALDAKRIAPPAWHEVPEPWEAPT